MQVAGGNSRVQTLMAYYFQGTGTSLSWALKQAGVADVVAVQNTLLVRMPVQHRTAQCNMAAWGK